MKLKVIIGFLGLAFSSFSSASPYGDADVLFGCIIQDNGKAKEVVVLRSGDDINYIFGEADEEGEEGVEPELNLKKKPSELTKSFNYSRVEGTALYTLKIPNKNYNYNISYFDDGNKKTGEVDVEKDGKAIKKMMCGSVWEQNLDNQNIMSGIPDEGDGIDSHVNNDPYDTGKKGTPSTPVVKIEIADVPYDQRTNSTATHRLTRHIYVYSLVDNVIINGLTIDRGSCHTWNIKPSAIKYGNRLDFELILSSKVAYANSNWNWMELNNQYSKCMWSEIEVKKILVTFYLTLVDNYHLVGGEKLP